MNKIEELKKQLEKAEQEEIAINIENIKIQIKNKYEGKCFKTVTSYGHKENFNYNTSYKYLKKIERFDFSEYSKKKILVGIEEHSFEIFFTINKKIKGNINIINFKESSPKEIKTYSIYTTHWYEISLNSEWLIEDFKNFSIKTEISKEEFEKEYNKLKSAQIKFTDEFHNEPLIDYYNLQYGNQIANKFNLTEKDIKNLFAYENKKNEICNFGGKNGCVLNHLTVVPYGNLRCVKFDYRGFGDGSDYEPYTKNFEITSVFINWKELLYPIRNKLKSVLKCAEELEKLKVKIEDFEMDISYTNYDNCLNFIYLNESTLNKVNNIICSFTND